MPLMILPGCKPGYMDCCRWVESNETCGMMTVATIEVSTSAN
ncbi:hypothetical protein QUF90_17685 [Desulfococcaceae bacterium HSG9]|nr:hypothetical protein [Desulfococcaceae bacterium HSG9]